MNIQEKSKIEYRSRINRVMHYIDMHLDQTLELKDIAEIANFSPYHFHRTFTFLIGETPIDYIQRLRIEKAASKLLQESPQPIAEIAYSCGFGSISLFNKIFKRYFGITPTQFRKTRRSDHAYHEVLLCKNAEEIKKIPEISTVNNSSSVVDKYRTCIDLQLEFNRSKNLFHKEACRILKFNSLTIDVIECLDTINQEEHNTLIDYATEKVLEEFCSVNQYFAFQEANIIDLRKIYSDLFLNIIKKDTHVNLIIGEHYENLKYWIRKTNPFSQTLYQEKDAILDNVVCKEYSAELQRKILHISCGQLSEPILDIGCGKTGNLVNSLRKDGFEAYGIDRFSDKAVYLNKRNWLEFDYGIEKWGTIVSNMSFSNHFVHNHLRKDGDFVRYAQKYMEILKSLKIGGCFCYSPDLPFIEQWLDKEQYSLVKYEIDTLPFETTVIKRLK